MTVQMGLLFSALLFVATHFLLSHPLRARLAGAMGERAFQGFYSLVAIATLGSTIYFYHIIGWRVMAKTPCGAPLGPRAPGSAGLRTNEPTKRMEPNHISRVATIHTASLGAQSCGSRPMILRWLPCSMARTTAPRLSLRARQWRRPVWRRTG